MIVCFIETRFGAWQIRGQRDGIFFEMVPDDRGSIGERAFLAFLPCPRGNGRRKRRHRLERALSRKEAAHAHGERGPAYAGHRKGDFTLGALTGPCTGR